MFVVYVINQWNLEKKNNQTPSYVYRSREIYKKNRPVRLANGRNIYHKLKEIANSYYVTYVKTKFQKYPS